MAVDIDGVNSTISTDKLIPQSGTALQIGESSDVITIPSGATITNSGTANGFGGGKVLQVVSAVLTSTFSSSSATFVDSGLNVSITPSATSSKILVLVQTNGSSASGGGTYVNLVRGSTDILLGDAATGMIQCSGGSENAGSEYENIHFALTYLDSPSIPATPVAINYKTQVRSRNTNAFYVNRQQNESSGRAARIPSTITCIEIGA